MRRHLIVAVVCVALASCAKGNDAVETSPPRSTTPQSSSTLPDTIPTTTTSSAPAPSTTVGSPEPTAGTEALVAGLAGEYHQVRNLDTSTEEMRVLLLYEDTTYDLRIEPIGYHESGSVVADPTTIEFFADGATDPELRFAGRGVANWTIGAGDYGPGLVLALQFADGRGYGYDGYDRGVDLYFVDD